jgi:hypothetical protein
MYLPLWLVLVVGGLSGVCVVATGLCLGRCWRLLRALEDCWRLLRALEDRSAALGQEAERRDDP